MGVIKSTLGIAGIAALGIGAYQAAHILPQLLPSRTQVFRSSSPPAVTIQWSPGQTLPQPGTPGEGDPGGQQSPAPATASINATSLNWAGVVQQGPVEKSVQASWQVPAFAAAATNPHSAVAEWVGLGGLQANALIQVGTITSPNSQGQAVTTVFWESLPGSAMQIAQVAPGTVVAAKIIPAGLNRWRLQLRVKGSSAPLINKIVTVTPRQARAIESSADWITEAPTTNNGVAPLAPVAATTMTQVRADHLPLSQMNPSTLQRIGLYSHSGQLLAEPITATQNRVVVNTAYGSLPASSTSQTPPAGTTWVVQQPSYGGGDGNWGEGGYPQQSGGPGWVTWSFNF